MKKILILILFTTCIAASLLTDSAAVYTKTVTVIKGSVTAESVFCSHYPIWSAAKELSHQYKINDIVQYNGKHYRRKDSGYNTNLLTPDKNKSWIEIECDKC